MVGCGYGVGERVEVRKSKLVRPFPMKADGEVEMVEVWVPAKVVVCGVWRVGVEYEDGEREMVPVPNLRRI